MLTEQFQKLSSETRKSYYQDIDRIMNSPLMDKFDNLKAEINEGNDHKVGVVKAIINTKMATSLDWEECFAAVNENM